jgi:hypothetical protein
LEFLEDLRATRQSCRREGDLATGQLVQLDLRARSNAKLLLHGLAQGYSSTGGDSERRRARYFPVRVPVSAQ